MNPLHFAIHFDPNSKLAAGLASFLFEELAAFPSGGGARIPVTFHAPPDGPEVAVPVVGVKHRVDVVLVERLLTTSAGGQERRVKRWADALATWLGEASVEGSGNAVVPVALDTTAFDLDTVRFKETSFVRLDHMAAEVDPGYLERQRGLLFAACVAALKVMAGSPAPPNQLSIAPVSVFLSHAKADLSHGSLNAIKNRLGDGPVDAWFDAADIDPGTEFSSKIVDGIHGASAVLAVVTDSFGSREWCRREILEAKRARVPLIVVDDVRSEEQRAFPYLGNARRIRWSEDRADYIVVQTVKEALAHRHHVLVNEKMATEADLAVGVSPELLTVQDVGDKTSILYPDPPLGQEELREIHRRLGEGFTVETPLERLCVNGADRWVGLSMSSAQDAGAFGGSAQHLALLGHDLNLMLLRAGCRIGYGGVLGAPELTNDSIDFTEILLDLIRGHVAPELSLPRVVNYVGWPIHLGKNRIEFAAQYPHGTDFEWIDPPAPEVLGVDPGQLEAAPGEFFPPTNAARRFAWSRGMTAMREHMNEEMDARIVFGGKMAGYVSRYPGVLEETLLALRAGKPTFLVGAFGGAARVAFDGLEGRSREELTSEWVKGADSLGGEQKPRYPFYDEILEFHRAAGLEMKTPEELQAELATLGRGGLADALGNGLSDDENRELATSRDAIRIVELILSGLGRRFSQ